MNAELASTNSGPLRLGLRDWGMVKAIAEEGGVTRAAKRLRLSQSALSHRLLVVEERLGVQLFERVGKQMKPTPVALALAASASTLLAFCRESEQVIESARTRLDPRPLRVAASCFSYYAWLAEILADFGLSHRDLDVSVRLQATRDEIGVLDQDLADFIITAQPPNKPSVQSMRVFSQEVVALLPADHSLVRQSLSGSTVKWNDLRGEMLLIPDLPSSDEINLRKAVWGKQSGSNRIRRVPLTEAMIALVKSGFGIAVVNRPNNKSPFEGHGLAIVPLSPRHDRPFYAIWPRANPRRLPLSELAQEITRRSNAGFAR
jgi:LysR family transcriptional regulator, regulator for metE and metH